MNRASLDPTPVSRLPSRGIVLGEASFGGPSTGDFESMARRRYQKPKPRTEGRQWVIYYWDDEFTNGERRRKKKRHVLGPATMGDPIRNGRWISFTMRWRLVEGSVF